MIEFSGIITSKCPLCSFSLATTILFYHWESRAGATMKPKIASVNLGWTERERPPKRPTMTGKRPTMTMNRAWTKRETLGNPGLECMVFSCYGPKIASVNRAWTERERPPKRPTMTGKRPTMTVNRAWNPRNHFSVWKFICYFLRGTATNWLCICSGMSVLVRAMIWRWLKKIGFMGVSNHASNNLDRVWIKFSIGFR